jgi:hypothetical protein
MGSLARSGIMIYAGLIKGTALIKVGKKDLLLATNPHSLTFLLYTMTAFNEVDVETS